MSPQFIEMTEVAKRYCELIEGVYEADGEWLDQLALLLPRLHAAVAALGFSEKKDCSLTPDLDARFEIFAQLRKLLGSRDSYWMQFDQAQDGQSMSGSLADDLTDIYCELKHGLKLLEQAPTRVFEDWRNGYKMHWGQHLMDAERHLYDLQVRDQL